MTKSMLQPQVTSDDRNIRSCYELPHRIYTSKVYPVESQNGSTILIYGHERGIRLIWQGGRAFKQNAPAPETEKPKVNGSKKKAATVIDLDDDDDDGTSAKSSPAFIDRVSFENGDSDDVSVNSQSILQDLDLALGSAVLHIALPSVSSDGALPGISYGEWLLSKRIVLAAACADGTIRTITLPLTPPSPESKARKELRTNITYGNAGNGAWGESMVVISNVAGHTAPCDQISITFSPRLDATDGDTGMEDIAQQPARRRSRSRSRQSISRPQLQDFTNEWDLLIASHRPDLSGVLNVYRIRLLQTKKDQKELDISQEQVTPWQTQYLPAPARALCFHPSSPSGYRNSSQLLLADSKGAVRIYDCSPTISRGRPSSRGSSEFIQALGDQGCWLATFYIGFNGSSMNSRAVAKRKQIVDAKWILGGRAIIVLLSDGEWGIWDIEGASPTAQGQGLCGNKGVGSIRGGTQTLWSLNGWVDLPASAVTHSHPPGSVGTEDQSKLAPKTPNTKRAGQQQLFSTSHDRASRYMSGGIAVKAGTSFSPEEPAEEAVAIWLADTVMITRSIRFYWSARARNIKTASGSLYGSVPGSMIKVDGINLGGETISHVDLFAPIATGATKGVPADILVTGEHRLIIMASQPAQSTESEPSTTLVQRMDIDTTASTTRRPSVGTGEMELDGIDATLSRMGAESAKSNGSPTKRKVGFRNV